MRDDKVVFWVGDSYEDRVMRVRRAGASIVRSIISLCFDRNDSGQMTESLVHELNREKPATGKLFSSLFFSSTFYFQGEIM